MPEKVFPPARKATLVLSRVSDTVPLVTPAPSTLTALLARKAYGEVISRRRGRMFASEPPVPMPLTVRAIQRSEAVEFVRRLGKYQLVIGLDAASPRDHAYSQRLKRKIHRERLPVIIGAGEMFPDPLPLFDAAHAILTTSEAEGFGYAGECGFPHPFCQPLQCFA